MLDGSYAQEGLYQLQPIDDVVTANFEVRAMSAAALFATIREEIRRFNPTLPILHMKMARTLIDDSILTER